MTYTPEDVERLVAVVSGVLNAANTERTAAQGLLVIKPDSRYYALLTSAVAPFLPPPPDPDEDLIAELEANLRNHYPDAAPTPQQSWFTAQARQYIQLVREHDSIMS